MVNEQLLAIVVAGLFAFGFAGSSSLGVVPNSYASSITPASLDSWCFGTSGLSYDYTTSTCTVTGSELMPYNVEIPSGEMLNITTGNVTISPGVTLTVDSGGVISMVNTCSPSCDSAIGIANFGNITNSGIINDSISGTCVLVSIGSCFGIENGGNFTNHGTINLESTMTCDISAACGGLVILSIPGISFVNYGTLNVEDTMTCSSTSQFCFDVYNAATFSNECGGTITIAIQDVFLNQGTMTNSGTITGSISQTQPNPSATCTLTTYTVSGSLDQTLCQSNGATWDLGTCTIPATVEWDVAAYGQLFINSPLTNDGILNNALQGEIYLSSATIDNVGTIDNYGLIQSLSGAITGNAVNNIQNGLSGGYIIEQYYPNGPLTPLLCQDNGATWNATSYTCTIPKTVGWVVAGLISNSLTIQSGQTLVINQSVNDGVGLFTGIDNNAGTITNHGFVNDNGFIINFHVQLPGVNLPLFANYGTLNITSYGQFDNQGNLQNEYGATITNYGAISNVALINNTGSISNIGIHTVFYAFCGSVLTGNPVSGITYLDGCQPTAQGSSTQTLSGGAASTGLISDTGVSVSITGASTQGGTSVTINAADLSSTENGVSVSGLGSPQFYDVEIFGATQGIAQVCITTSTSSAGLTMQYWNDTTLTWMNASPITYPQSNEVCGNIPVSSLTGTNVAIGLPNMVTTPQFPFGTILGVFVPIAALALFAGERRFKRPLA